MKKLMRILVVHSAADLYKHKSFFFLIFILVLADRGLKLLSDGKKLDPGLSGLRHLGADTAAYLFVQLPGVIRNLITDYRTFLVLGGLFIFKQIISLWPSSDLRRMHRQERGAFGIGASLAAIRWDQVVWDAIAVSTLCLSAGLWMLICFLLNRLLWQLKPSAFWLISLGGMVSLILPTVLAGFSYSSKLAVLSRGSFKQKLLLFFKLFVDLQVAGPSWLFFSARIFVEFIFVVGIPAYILLTVETYWMRILLAALLATPVYSYLKMASFKFFLVTYRPFELVRNEYRDFYQANTGPGEEF